MITVDINLDVDFFERIKADVLADAQEAIANEIVNAKVTPYDTGATQESMIKDSKIEKSAIVLKNTTPYAEKIYYGGPFKTRPNTNASRKWYDKFINEGGDEIITNRVADAIDNNLK
jgi:hypothetical protein